MFTLYAVCKETIKRLWIIKCRTLVKSKTRGGRSSVERQNVKTFGQIVEINYQIRIENLKTQFL